MIIAIDGPSGAGKSTISKMLADSLSMHCLDTGAMYRAVAYLRLHGDIPEHDEKSLVQLVRKTELNFHHTTSGTQIFWDGIDVTVELRAPIISQEASRISAWSAIRKVLVELQRKICGSGDFVVEGRDIGSVVFPHTAYKFYLDANVQIRASRRQQQLKEQGIIKDVKTIVAEIKKRDFHDSTRKDSPLTKAAGAILIDSTSLTKAEVVQKMIIEIEKIKEKLGKKGKTN
ncbi:(d)CMP kinase [candidate division CSSED10-310 bacterium]|uniref:Cytidylate kinase n=1 Tax=candidate division CSSED10-310 bacterium TaxID=2855610 RepID=A0ABV6Z526_UNCC1